MQKAHVGGIFLAEQSARLGYSVFSVSSRRPVLRFSWRGCRGMIAGAGRFLVQERHRPVLASATFRAEKYLWDIPRYREALNPTLRLGWSVALNSLLGKPLPNKTKLAQIRAKQGVDPGEATIVHSLNA